MRHFLLPVIGFFILVTIIIAGPKTNVPTISSPDEQTQETEILSPELYASGVPWARKISSTKTVWLGQFVRTKDGGFVMAGNIYSSDHRLWDGLCVKFNASGKVVWKKVYGGYKGESISSILQTQDKGLLLGGCCSTDNDNSAWVVKTNATGAIEWGKSLRLQYAESLPYSSSFDHAIQTIDGGYLLAGGAKLIGSGNVRKLILVKIDMLGNLTWEKLYETADDDYCRGLVPTSDGGYLIGCRSWSKGKSTYINVRLLKVDSSGTPVWQKTYGKAWLDEASDLIAHRDGGYVFAGHTEQSEGWGDAWVVRLDDGGNIIWQKRYGGTKDDWFTSIQQTKDGGYIAAGYSNSFSSTYDVWYVKLSATGSIQWQYRLIGNDNELTDKVLQTPDNKYVIAGNSYVEGNNSVRKSFLHQLSSTGLSSCPNMSDATDIKALSARVSITSQQVTLKDHEVVYNNSSIKYKTDILKISDACK